MMPRTIRDHTRRLLGFCLRPVYGGVGCIVVLHRVVPRNRRSALAENRALEITVEDLRALLEWVRAKGLEAIALDAVPGRLARPRGRKFIAFSLDDGYRDNLTEAAPIFRHYEVPFTVHVTTGFIARTASVWWYFLERLLAGRKAVHFVWNGEALQWPCASPPERDAAFASLAKLIRRQGVIPRDALLRILGEATGIDPMEDAEHLMLTWDQVRELASEPLAAIGAHTVGHHSLNRLSGAEALAEMTEARDEIAAQIGRAVRHFAYPFGGRSAVNEREFQLARRAGFCTATTTRVANLFPGHTRFLDRLPRLVVSGNYPVISNLRALESGFAAVWRGNLQRLVTT